jgi:hypothetical protein
MKTRVIQDDPDDGSHPADVDTRQPEETDPPDEPQPPNPSPNPPRP